MFSIRIFSLSVFFCSNTDYFAMVLQDWRDFKKLDSTISTSETPLPPSTRQNKLENSGRNLSSKHSSDGSSGTPPVPDKQTNHSCSNNQISQVLNDSGEGGSSTVDDKSLVNIPELRISSVWTNSADVSAQQGRTDSTEPQVESTKTEVILSENEIKKEPDVTNRTDAATHNVDENSIKLEYKVDSLSSLQSSIDVKSEPVSADELANDAELTSGVIREDIASSEGDGATKDVCKVEPAPEPEEGLITESQDVNTYRLVCQSVEDLRELAAKFSGSRGKEGTSAKAVRIIRNLLLLYFKNAVWFEF